MGGNSKAEAAAQKLHALTSLRFFAALFVVVYHSYWWTTPSTTSDHISTRMASLGFLSVGFFFLLSGYILAMVYLRRERALDRKNFFVARFARIYPLYLLTLLSDIPEFIRHELQMGRGPNFVQAIKVALFNMVLLQAWKPSMRGLDNPNWSISVEAVFYLLFPFIGAILWRLHRRSLLPVAAAVWLTSELGVYLVAPHVPENVVKFNPLLHLGTFVLGILLARWQTSQDTVPHSIEGGPTKRRASAVTALVLALAALVILVAYLPRLPLGIVHDGLMAPAFMAVIWAFSVNGSRLARMLSARWLVVLGEASFGLYLIHVVILHIFDDIDPALVHRVYPLYLLVCIGLSVVSFYWFETPMRTWIIAAMKTRSRETRESAADAQ